MTRNEISEILRKHKMWIDDEEGGERADLRGADLSEADLSGADLSGADLSGANLDFSCLPLWCGSLNAEFDDKQIIQIVYHAVKSGINSKNTSDEVKNELSKLIGLANKFHRVQECGTIIA